RQWLLALIAAVVEPRAKQQLRTVLDLAAALLDRMLDLERVEGGLGIEAHEPVGIVVGWIGRGAALPEHGTQTQRLEGCDLLGAEIVAGDRINDLAWPKPARGDQFCDGG